MAAGKPVGLIDIRGLDPAAVLAALHRAAVPGALHGGYKNHPALDVDAARSHLEQARSFSYIDGRAMFLTIDGDQLHAGEYDKRNGGPGSAAKALAPLMDGRGVRREIPDGEWIEQMHKLGVPR